MGIFGFGKDPRTHLSRVAVGEGYISVITYHAGPRGYKVEVVMPNATVVADGRVYDTFRQASCAVKNYLEQR
jgi:hypothetical protein